MTLITKKGFLKKEQLGQQYKGISQQHLARRSERINMLH